MYDVETAKKQILRHLSALVHDEQISQSWSILPLIEHFLNSAIHSEIGLKPLEAKFDFSDFSDFYLPISSTSVTSPLLLKKLKTNILGQRRF